MTSNTMLEIMTSNEFIKILDDDIRSEKQVEIPKWVKTLQNGIPKE